MDVSEVLQVLAAEGVAVAAKDGRLMAAPRDRLLDAHRELLRAHKAEIIARLQAESVHEAAEERAAIAEFDGGVPVREAERTVVSKQSCATCRHRTRAATCGEPVDAGLADYWHIVWPPAGHGATCSAWRLNPAEAIGLVYVEGERRNWTRAELEAWLADAREHPADVLDVLRAGGRS
jgi:hypothetical protein